ncbi:hypothetical protein QBC37DRAFT_14535 [Rhypophila decipiens]|uniref:FAD-binding domain-containing protein n=1 Tax=Rhypophila decipiens TaxID=261697 RepID=A0AAN6Y8A7_9PEZI|nr:hypothetical protein QBC37DRAFT_14535 [Rhypophila decipiens]
MSSSPSNSPSFSSPEQQTSKNKTRLRIIIIGAGPTGLLLAHIFSQLQGKVEAGIEFIVLERRSREEIARPEHGAALVIWPHTMRVMDQLGLLEGARAIGVETDELKVCDARAREYHRLALEDWTRSLHGANPLFFHRAEFLRLLYDSLPPGVQDKIITGKAFADIQTDPDQEDGGVVVTCSDGTIKRGDIVIGADGVHSKVREVIMRESAKMNKAGESAVGIREKHDPFVAEFRCVFGYTAHLLPGLEPRKIYEMHSTGASSQVFTFRDKAGFMIYQKMDRPSTLNNRSTEGPETGKTKRRYTFSDVEEFMLQVGNFPVASCDKQANGTGSVKVNDLYKASCWTVLSDLHEGIVDHWHAGGAGRMVLVGDAASKQTPNMGHGWNCCVQDVVVLSNLISSLVKSKSHQDDEQAVTVEGLDVLFTEYQRTRYPLSKACLETSMNWARSQAWDSWWYWFLNRHVQTTVSTLMWATKIQPMVYGLGPQMHLGHVLNFLPERSKLKGVIPWVNVSPDGRQDQEEAQV